MYYGAAIYGFGILIWSLTSIDCQRTRTDSSRATDFSLNCLVLLASGKASQDSSWLRPQRINGH